ncbi:MAG: TetR/AcrR family transcriptional regulator [Epulopiscium sp.]|nr:TetR/AcrR family transcriptional regulator [Candidatus Epulonipiscium sp.]
MNEKFFGLSKEKQFAIINAGFEVFARNEYKRASTDEIGRIAGISKGLLFYYFHNKKSFYLFLFDYAFQRVTEYVLNADIERYTDFFELCEYSAKKKQEMLNSSPYLFDFLLRAFYSKKEDVSEELNKRLSAILSQMYENYFKNIDTSKFKPGVNPQEILQMMTLLADGYIHELQRAGKHMTIDEFMKKYKRWVLLFKQMAYKEEFIHD